LCVGEKFPAWRNCGPVSVLSDARQGFGFTAGNRHPPKNKESCTIRGIDDGAAIRSPGESRDYVAFGRQTSRLTPATG